MIVNASVTSPDRVVDSRQDDDLRKAAQSFEAIILREVIGCMRKAKLGGELFQSSATDQFREMADARTADEIAKQGTFGIAEMLHAQFVRRSQKQ